MKNKEIKDYVTRGLRQRNLLKVTRTGFNDINKFFPYSYKFIRTNKTIHVYPQSHYVYNRKHRFLPTKLTYLGRDSTINVHGNMTHSNFFFFKKGFRIYLQLPLHS